MGPWVTNKDGHKNKASSFLICVQSRRMFVFKNNVLYLCCSFSVCSIVVCMFLPTSNLIIVSSVFTGAKLFVLCFTIKDKIYWLIKTRYLYVLFISAPVSVCVLNMASNWSQGMAIKYGNQIVQKNLKNEWKDLHTSHLSFKTLEQIMWVSP